MRIKSFNAWRPPAELARDVASLPYDVGDLEDAKALASDNPRSFLHIERPEVDLPEDVDPNSGLDHRSAADQFRLFREKGWLVKDQDDAFYVYAIRLNDHEQVGIIACCHVEDYEKDLIKKHEKTKKPVEDQRTEHVLTVGAQTGPIFLVYRDAPEVNGLVDDIMKGEPLYDFTASDGIRHRVWKVLAGDTISGAFASVPVCYVADGHHRTAAAARAGQKRRAANPDHTGNEEYNWFLSVLFPASHLKVLAYNRLVADLNGRSASAFLDAVRERAEVKETTAVRPASPGSVCMYLEGRWYELTWLEPTGDDPVASLDVSILQERVLAPLLGIDDPRNNSRIAYAGGFDSVERMVKKVDAGRAAVAFSVHPTTVDQLMAIADAGRIMPPKSTWFEPKLRSGLFVHTLE